MATKIVLNKKKANDDYGILGLQSFDGGKTKKSLGIKISVKDFEEHFDKRYQLFNPEINHLKEFNEKIKDAVFRFNNGLELIEIKTKKVENHLVIKVKKEDTNRLSFIDYFDSRMNLKKTEGHKYSVLNVLRKLKKYLNHLEKDDLYFDELTPEFIISFKNYCLSVNDPKKLTENGVRNYFKVLKSVYHDAYNTEYYSFSRNPFSLVKYEKSDKKEKNPLSINQVKALMELELDYNLSIVRNMFYFQILNNGMRCSDVVFMRYGDFKNGRLSYKMMKTNSTLKIATGIKTMLVLADILGELNVYHNYIETVKIAKREFFGNKQFTLKDIDEKLNLIENNIRFNNDPDFESHNGYIIKKTDIESKNYIDLKIELIDEINDLFTADMTEIINKQDDREFVFLKFISPKSVAFFKDYKKGDVLSYEQFQKYRNIRNIYNKRLYMLTDIYNNEIPLKVKDRWKYIIKLSSHVARNTFVYILLKENVDIFKISNALAHSELKTTQNYIKSGFDMEASDDAGLVIQKII